VGGEGERAVLIAVVAVVVIVVVAAFSMVTMMGGYGWRGMMGSGMMPFGGMGFGWPILWASVFVIILLVGLYFVFTGFRREEEPSTKPVEILKERYARGEITSEEFQKMKRDLA
jgi:putative membrane protein